MARSRYRRHSPHFKSQLCTDIRPGVMERREAQRTYKLSANRTRLFRRIRDRIPAREVEGAADGKSEILIACQFRGSFHQFVDGGRCDEQVV